MWRIRKASILVLATVLAACHGFQPHLPPTVTSRWMTPKKNGGFVGSAPTLSSSSSATRKQPLVRQGQRQALTPLSAVSLMNIASSPLGAISVLAGIVLVHEAGHYLAARSFGIAVEEFSVGVGPKLFGFKAFGDEFNLRLLPLGGYVRFPENYNATLLEEMRAQAVEDAKAQAERQKEERENEEREKDRVVSNRLLNIITFGATERKRKEQEAAAQAKAQAETQAKAEKVPWWKRQNNEEDTLDVPEVDIPYDDNPNLLQNRPWQERAVVLSGGVIFNLLLSFSIYFGQINFGEGIPSPVFEPGVVVSSAPRPQTASEGLLRKGDVILDINGRLLAQSASPTVFESQRAINDLIAEIRSTPNGQDIQLTVLRDNQLTNVVRIKPKPMTGGTTGAPSIGVLLTPNYVKSAIMKTSNPIEAARLAADYTITLTRETANGLLSVIANAFKSSGTSGVQVSGPIGLIKTGSDVVSTQDLAAIALFAAALSINLGVVNALPLPALDGGQLLFVIAEALTGRKVDQRVQEGITGVAVVFLLLISLGAAVGDLSNIVVGR